jgi:hypothetical protein
MDEAEGAMLARPSRRDSGLYWIKQGKTAKQIEELPEVELD